MIGKRIYKTPDEIKLGLVQCTYDKICRYRSCNTQCPYFEDSRCLNYMMSDALEYIELLERERDAAVEELRRTHNCNICKHHKKSGGTCEGWSVCGYNIPNWEWRGVSEVKADEN